MPLEVKFEETDEAKFVLIDSVRIARRPNSTKSRGLGTFATWLFGNPARI